MSESPLFPATSMPDPTWWTALWPDPDAVVSRMGLAKRVERAVDLCCGDGYFTPALARFAREVHAINLDMTLLEAARRRVASAGLESRCAFLAVDAYDVASVSPDADVIFLANTFHGVPDKARLAAAAAKALKRGGVFSLINWRRLPRETTRVLGEARGPASELRLDPSDLASIVAPAGFQAEEPIDLPPYHYGMNFRRA